MKHVKLWLSKRKLRRSAIKFIFSYKGLSDNGTKRIDNLIGCLEHYKHCLEHERHILIETIIIVTDCIDGLRAFKKGNIDGMTDFEHSDVINKLKLLLSIK